MSRIRLTQSSLVAVLFLCFPLVSAAADKEPAAGYWKYVIRQEREGDITFLFALTKTEDGWFADLLDCDAQLRIEPKFVDVKVVGDTVSFRMTFSGQELMNFEGKVSADRTKLIGSISEFKRPIQTVQFYASQLKNLRDPKKLLLENFEQLPLGNDLMNAGFELLNNASALGLDNETLKQITGKMSTFCSRYGPRWEKKIYQQMAESLIGQKQWADMGYEFALKVKSLTSKTASISEKLTVTDLLFSAAQKMGKTEQAQAYAQEKATLIREDEADYRRTSRTFPVKKYAGRKIKSDRAVFVELVTGAECPPCVAADIAFDALLDSYDVRDVVFVQYHVHIPGPDPLTAPFSQERIMAYEKLITGAPTYIINGQAAPAAGGSATESKTRYESLVLAINKALEVNPVCQLTLKVNKTKEAGFTIDALVSQWKDVKDYKEWKLRCVIVEDKVRYKGGNGVRYHHHVARDMPGGAEGIELSAKKLSHQFTVKPDDIRNSLSRYLALFEQSQGAFPNPEKPLELKNLKALVFLQNTKTGEVIDVEQADLK